MSKLDARLNRRTMLRAGCLSPLGFSLADLFAARKQASAAEASGEKAKSCIFIFLTGGPSQFETFDPKPGSGPEVAGPFQPIATNSPGTHISELLPQLATRADKYAVIRSTYHNSNTHGVGVHYNLTGMEHAPRRNGEPQLDRRDPPGMGGAIRQLRGDRNGLPGAVHLPTRIGDQNNFQWAGQHAGFLGRKFDPVTLIQEDWSPGTLPSSFLPPKGLDENRMTGRKKLLASLQSRRNSAPDEFTADYDWAQQQALDVLGSGSAWEAFLIDSEKPETLQRYGDNKFGRSLLVARRLVEAGVSLVTVPWMHLHSTKNFDTHSKNFSLMKDLLTPPVDQGVSALLDDLGDRGMLDDTMVVWTGEFGRTPKINKNAGRDHWGKVYSTFLAGGGIQGGQFHGASDKLGGEPADKPVHARDFIATVYHALGFAPGTFVQDAGGRRRPIVEGQPVLDLF
ncbi:MAG: DUF1501 domain-containing protein [Planctomycetales bacterium]